MVGHGNNIYFIMEEGHVRPVDFVTWWRRRDMTNKSDFNIIPLAIEWPDEGFQPSATLEMQNGVPMLSATDHWTRQFTLHDDQCYATGLAWSRSSVAERLAMFGLSSVDPTTLSPAERWQYQQYVLSWPLRVLRRLLFRFRPTPGAAAPSAPPPSTA